MALASTVVYSKVQSRARLQQRKHRVRVPLLGETPKRSLIGVGITCVDLGLETQQQLHQVLAPLLGRDQQSPLPACGGGVGVGAGLQEALDILVLAQTHLRDERGLEGVGVLALECRVPSARDQEAFAAVLERERRRG